MKCKTCGMETFTKKELKDIYKNQDAMTEAERKMVIDIYGPNFKRTDIPTFIRNRGSIKAPSILKPR